MDRTKKSIYKTPIWLKVILTIIFAFISYIYELLIFIAASCSKGGLSVGLFLMLSIPVFVFCLIWFPKKRPFMISLGIAFAVLISGVAISLGIYYYEESLIIDTSPSINISEYLPFDRNSKIVKMRSEKTNFNENAPKIDGAAALFPVYSAFVNATYPEDTVLGEDVFLYNNTPDGYKSLAEKKTDIFIGVYPSEEQIQYAEKNDTHFEYTPIGYDAFVFFVHKDNPIDSLTTEQIQGIYSGEITNWKQIGGQDEEIVAYQRNNGSGSQSMLIRFMGDKAVMKAPSEMVNGFMGGIIEEVANYKSVTASIGFSFRFYVEGIIQNPDIKMIAIDGVKPTAENVQNQTYPICTPFYAVTYQENNNPNTDTLITWILSDEGQDIIEKSGYIGVGRKNE